MSENLFVATIYFSLFLQAYWAMMDTNKYLNIEHKTNNHTREIEPIGYHRKNFEEFWSELSLAYLWDRESEFNDYFPFNRAQLREYDPESFTAIEQVWSQLE